jgi:hypothetical protein
MAARKGEQGKGLIVEIEAPVTRPTIKVDNRRHRGVRGHEMVAEVDQRVPRRLLPRAVPAQPTGLAV